MDSLYVVILQPNQLSHFNYVQLFATPWTVTCQALLSMGLSRQEYWTALPCLPPFPTHGSNMSLLSLLHWQTGSLPLVPPGKNQFGVWFSARSKTYSCKKEKIILGLHGIPLAFPLGLN